MPEALEPPERPVGSALREAVQRWRLVLAREPLSPDVTQRDQLTAWDAALRASGLPVAGLDADPPRPRYAIAAPLGASFGGEAELVDVYLVERVPVWRLREAIAGTLPPGYALRQAFDAWLGEAALPGQVVASVYRAAIDDEGSGGAALDDACRALLDAPTIERERVKGSGTVRYDLRPFIEGLAIDRPATGGTHIRMTLRHDPERGIGRPDEVLAALTARVGRDVTPPSATVVRERLVLAPPPAPPPPRPRGPRRGGQPTAPASRPRK